MHKNQIARQAAQAGIIPDQKKPLVPWSLALELPCLCVFLISILSREEKVQWGGGMPPSKKAKKRSARSATSKSDAKTVIKTMPTEDEKQSGKFKMVESHPGSVLQSVFDILRLTPAPPRRKRLRPPGLPRSLLFRSLPLPPSSFDRDAPPPGKRSRETLTAVPLRDQAVRGLMEDITSNVTKVSSIRHRASSSITVQVRPGETDPGPPPTGPRRRQPPPPPAPGPPQRSRGATTAVPLRDQAVRDLMEDITCNITKVTTGVRSSTTVQVRPSDTANSLGLQKQELKLMKQLSNVDAAGEVSYECKKCEFTSGRCNTVAAHVVDTHQPEGVTAASLSHVCCEQGDNSVDKKI